MHPAVSLLVMRQEGTTNVDLVHGAKKGRESEADGVTTSIHADLICQPL